MGAAATAGVVAAAASPAIAAPAATATPGVAALPASRLAIAQTPPDSLPASQVTVVPAGEITKLNVQAVLEDMDGRLSRVQLIQDLQVAMTLVDDFMGNTATSGTIGQLGWALPATATGTAAVALAADEPGIFIIGTGTSSSGWQSINLGTNNLHGAPVLMCEYRLKIPNLNNASNKFSSWFGLHNAVNGSEPTTGMYFRYSAADGVTWQAVCADNGPPNVVSTNVPVNTDFHRFRITSDGAGVARFYIDDVPVALIFSSLPTVNRYSANVAIRKTAGTTARTARVDYFAMRYEKPR